jgi:hypothetical protein
VAITYTDNFANEVLDTGFDAIFNSGKLRIYSGSKPATANLASTGTLLWEEDLPADAFSAAAARAKAKAGTWQANGAAAGTAGWFRLCKASDTNAVTQAESRVDGTVTATGSGGDMTLDNTSIAVGQSVTVNTFSVSLP